MSILSSDSTIKEWDLEEWSDEEGLQDVKDLQYLEFLNAVHKIRIDRWEHRRLDWKEHVRQLVHEDSFENEYRMPLSCNT